MTRGDLDEGRPASQAGPGRSALVGLVVLTVLLQGISWGILEGYQLADSVEYMERARALVRAEEVIDSRQIRSFGFSALLVPFFAVAEWVELEDFRALVWAIRTFQMLLGVGLVVTCVQLGTRIAGARAGLAAGFLVAANPVFLQYSVSPLADVAAGLCVGRALLPLLEPLDARRGARAGLWLGLALLMAYKTAPIAAVLVALAVLRDRRRAWPGLGWLAAAYAAWVAVEVVLDKLVYRAWGASLVAYFGDNVFGLLVRIFLKVGLDGPARRLYDFWQGTEKTDVYGTERLLEFQVQPGDWYLTHLPEMFVWPVLLVVAVALVRALRRPRWATSLLLAAAAVNLVLLNLKSSKEFRLWLPLLPMLAPLLGAGLASILGDADGRAARWRRALVGALAVATVALGVDTLTARNTRKFSGFWRAIDHIAARVAEEGRPPGEKARVASAYHWAVFLRERPNLALKKLAHQLDGWPVMGEPAQLAVLGELRDQDWFITHLPLLTSPEQVLLARYVNAWYEVDALFWDREQYEELGPVLVFKRKADEAPFDPARRTLFDRIEDGDPDALRRRMGFPEPVRLIRPAHGEEMQFLGATYEVLPGDGHGWLTCYYYAATPFLADYKFMHRLTAYDERHVWQDNHPPAYGVYPTPTWQPGWILRESRPVVAAANPYDWEAPYRPIGGAYRRGDLVPTYLWMDVVTDYLQCVHCGEPLVIDRAKPHVCGGVARADEATDGRLVVTGRLERARPGESTPIRTGALAGALRTEAGWRWSRDDFTLVQRLFLPVHPDARVPDDGRPIPD